MCVRGMTVSTKAVLNQCPRAVPPPRCRRWGSIGTGLWPQARLCPGSTEVDALRH